MNNPLLVADHHFPTRETPLMLPGAVGQLEAIVVGTGAVPTTVGVICHPHPLYGGTMHNKVVTTIARTWHKMGLMTIRFNFRGVGLSEGHYANSLGETDDLLAVLDLVRAAYPQAALWLAGFSFGAYVALQAAGQRPIAQLVTVAPPVERFDFSHLPPVHCPWLVIQGDQDEVVAPDQVYAWLQSLTNPPDLIRLPQAGHFFHGQLGRLQTALETLAARL